MLAEWDINGHAQATVVVHQLPIAAPAGRHRQLPGRQPSAVLPGKLQKRLPIRVAFFSRVCGWSTTLVHAHALLALDLQAFAVALFGLFTETFALVALVLLETLTSVALPGVGESFGVVPIEAPAIQVSWVVPAIGSLGDEIGVLFLLVPFEDGGDVFG